MLKLAAPAAVTSAAGTPVDAAATSGTAARPSRIFLAACFGKIAVQEHILMCPKVIAARF